MGNFRSGFERTIDTQLKASGVKYSYETLKIPYSINYTYNPDFILSNGIIIEVKGYFRAGDIAKMRAVKTQNPDLRICFVFMDAHKRISGQKQTHAQWAERHGFEWADGRVPSAWLKS